MVAIASGVREDGPHDDTMPTRAAECSKCGRRIRRCRLNEPMCNSCRKGHKDGSPRPAPLANSRTAESVRLRVLQLRCVIGIEGKWGEIQLRIREFRAKHGRDPRWGEYRKIERVVDRERRRRGLPLGVSDTPEPHVSALLGHFDRLGFDEPRDDAGNGFDPEQAFTVERKKGVLLDG